MAVLNSIIIVSHNHGAALPAMLASLKTEESSTSEVIVVDNASFDGSVETVAERFPQVRLIRSSKNRGFAAAAQRGINEAQGSIAVICHSDLLVEMHALAELADRVREGAGRRVVAAVPRLIGRDGVEQPGVGRLPGIGRGMIGVFNPSAARRCYLPQLDHVADHEWTTLVCLAIDCDQLARLGSLDSRFFLYYADADLCQRIHDKSYRIVIHRDLAVVHCGASPNDPQPDHLRRIMRKDQQRYFEKHRPAWEQKLLNVDQKIYRLLKREPA